MADYNPEFEGTRNEGFDPFNRWDPNETEGVLGDLNGWIRDSEQYDLNNNYEMPIGPAPESPDDFGGGYGAWFSSPETPQQSTPGSVLYPDSGPSIGWSTPNPTPSPFFSGDSDPIWGTQEPPWVPPTPDGSPQWTDDMWQDFFQGLPNPDWNEQQWNDFLNSTETVPVPWSPGSTYNEPNYHGQDEVYPGFDGTYLDSPWHPTPSAPIYTDPIADDWIANYQTPPDAPQGPVYPGWDDILAAGFTGIAGTL